MPNDQLLVAVCTFCGWTFDVESVAAELVVDGCRTGCLVCQSCLRGGVEGVRTALGERAQAFEQRAANLRQVADGTIELPSYQEYTSAQHSPGA